MKQKNSGITLHQKVHNTENERMKKIFDSTRSAKQTGVAILLPDTQDFKTKLIRKDITKGKGNGSIRRHSKCHTYAFTECQCTQFQKTKTSGLEAQRDTNTITVSQVNNSFSQLEGNQMKNHQS